MKKILSVLLIGIMLFSLTACGSKGEKISLMQKTYSGDDVKLSADLYYSPKSNVTVEYDEEKNQSKLHFECTYIDTPMKNAILSYVYNVIPDEEKEIIQAMDLAEKDEKNREETKSTSSQNEKNNTESSGSNDTNSTSSQVNVAEKVNPSDITNVTDPLNLPAIEEDF